MLELKNINLTFNKGDILERKILDDLNCHILPGEFVVIIGGNGSGKSTLMNIISGALAPDQGMVLLESNDITAAPQYQRSAAIAKVLQDPKVGTIETMTIYENLAFAACRGQRRSFWPYSNQQRRRQFQDNLAILEMGLEDRLDSLVANLSGGQRQALSLIMAVTAPAKILLLDEITAALDPKSASQVMQIAARIIREQQRTTIMITHNMSHAIEFGDRTLLLANGKFIQEFCAAEKQTLTPLNLVAKFSEACAV